jgi:hypothetical protein
MSSRRDTLAATERRIRRRLGRHNLDLLKAQKPGPKVLAHGGYKLREAASGTILLGEMSYEFSASLEEVEAWLDRLDQQA